MDSTTLIQSPPWREVSEILKQEGVHTAIVFGSLSQGTARAKSDVELESSHGIFLSHILRSNVYLIKNNGNFIYRKIKEMVYFNEDMRPIIQNILKERLEQFTRGY